MKLSFLTFLAPIAFFLACTFQNHEEEFNDIIIDESKIPYVLLNFQGNEIEIVENTRLIFQLKNDRSGAGFIEYSFVVDGVRFDFEGRGSNNAYFEISPNWYKGKSVFNLTFEGLVKTGTGSLADRIDAEIYKISGSWTLKVDNHVPEKVTPELKFNNGYLEVSWSRANSNANFRYELKIERKNNKGFPAVETVLFNKSDDLVFLDKTFNGQQKKYWIEIVSNWYNVIGDTTAFQIYPISCQHHDLEDYGVALVVDQIPFYNHDVKLDLHYGNTKISDINLHGDSILIHNPNFLTNPVFDIVFEVANIEYDQMPYLASLLITKPLKYPIIDTYVSHAPYEIFYDSNRDRVILVGAKGILELDADNYQVLNSTAKSLPWGTKFFPHNSGKIFSVNNCGSHLVFDAIDLVNDYTTSSIKLYERIPSTLTGIWGGCVTNCTDERLVFQPMHHDIFESIIYNYKNDQIEYKDSLSEFYMSGSGKYVMNKKGSQILKLESGIWKKIGTINFNGPWHFLKIFDNWNGFENLYIFDGENIFLFQWPEELDVYSEIDFSAQFSFESTFNDPYYDQASGMISGWSSKSSISNELMVMDASDMTVRYRFDILKELTGKFIKNACYFSNGYIIDLR